jgi:hypothetical protein
MLGYLVSLLMGLAVGTAYGLAQGHPNPDDAFEMRVIWVFKKVLSSLLHFPEAAG